MNPIYLEDPECALLFTDDLTQMAIPLINKFSERVAYALADTEDFRELLKYTFSVQCHGGVYYAISSIGKAMHQLIIPNVPDNLDIDHVFHSLDNRKAHLKVKTRAANIHNTNRKTSKTTSQYKGVSKDNPGKGRPANGKWRAGIRAAGVSYNLGSYSTEYEAARIHDMYAIYHYRYDAVTNGTLTWPEIEYILVNGVPDQYKRPEKAERDLPPGIGRTPQGGYRVRKMRHGKEVSRVTETLEDALIVQHIWTQLWKEEDDELERKRRLAVIRNSDGIAVIPVKSGDDWYEALVDDSIWGELSQYSWSIGKGVYAQGYVDGTCVQMHLHIFRKYRSEIPKGMTVDHIVSTRKLDNRFCNLRLADKRLQGHNRTKYTNNLDRFKGVSFTGHSFMVVIEDKVYGYYETEEEAAHKANQVYFQLYGQNALLNVVPNTRTTKDNRLPREMITRAYIESIGHVKELKHLIRVLKLNEGNGGPYNLEKTKGKQLLAIRDEILSNKFKDKIGIVF
jgi:hypothetical protein